MRILVIEDDRDTLSFIRTGLEEAGHVVKGIECGDVGLQVARTEEFDAIVLDRYLPNIKDGLDIVRTLRAENNNTPILILSSLGDLDHRVDGLKVGSDDYLTKPFAFSELLARVEAIVRRYEPAKIQIELCVDELHLDLLKREVRRANKKILLSNREFQILEYLMRNSGKVVTRSMLREKVWNYHFDTHTGIIDTHMSRLRGKVDRGFDYPLIHTVRGSGYKICRDDQI